MEKYSTRSAVPEEYKWDLSCLCKDEKDFKKRIKALEKRIEHISDYVGCTGSSENLLDYIKFDIEVGMELMDLGVYAMTLSDSDLSQAEPIDMVGQVDRIESLYSVASSFFEPELLSLDRKKYEKLFEDDKLLEYKPYLDRIYRRKDHVLSEQEEKIVSSLTETLGSFSQMSSTLLNSSHDYGTIIMDDGREEKLMSTNYRILMKELSREKRKSTYLQFNKVKSQYADISASLLNDYVRMQNALSRIYKFDSSWERKLFGLNMSSKVFDTLVQTAKDNKEVVKKFRDLKRDALHLDELMPWDLPLELYELDKEYTIPDAQNLVLEALKPLGDDYIDHFKSLITNRAVDYCQYKGKCSGGYNVSTLGQKDSKILMSFNGDLSSVSTLAHEGGHYTHHTFIYENNEPIYRDHATIVCEVASLTNECLLSHYLVEHGSREEALAGLANLIDVFMSNFFGAIQEGEIERQFYKYAQEGGTLTKDYLNKLSEENIKDFYPKDAFIHEYQKSAWISRSHYYMFFYMFSYAICIAVASHVANEIIKGNKEMLENYKKFLKTGSNVWPSDTFKIIGVDLEDKKVYENAIKYFDNLLDEFRSILEKE